MRLSELTKQVSLNETISRTEQSTEEQNSQETVSGDEADYETTVISNTVLSSPDISPNSTLNDTTTFDADSLNMSTLSISQSSVRPVQQQTPSFCGMKGESTPGIRTGAREVPVPCYTPHVVPESTKRPPSKRPKTDRLDFLKKSLMSSSKDTVSDGSSLEKQVTDPTSEDEVYWPERSVGASTKLSRYDTVDCTQFSIKTLMESTPLSTPRVMPAGVPSAANTARSKDPSIDEVLLEALRKLQPANKSKGLSRQAIEKYIAKHHKQIKDGKELLRDAIPAALKKNYISRVSGFGLVGSFRLIDDQ